MTRITRESFAVFRERGILHDYESRKAGEDSVGPAGRKRMDGKQPPPEGRRMLKERGGAARRRDSGGTERGSSERRARDKK
jgi:hypothetical protein